MENGSTNPGPPMRGGFRGRGGNQFLIQIIENVIKSKWTNQNEWMNITKK